MTEQEFAGPFLQLCLLYRLKADLPEYQVQELYDATWFTAVRHLRADEWQQAVNECVREWKSADFRPMPGDLLGFSEAARERRARLAQLNPSRALAAPDDERLRRSPTSEERSRWKNAMAPLMEKLHAAHGPLAGALRRLAESEGASPAVRAPTADEYERAKELKAIALRQAGEWQNQHPVRETPDGD